MPSRKNTRLPAVQRSEGPAAKGLLLMSLTSNVPASVPSLLHSSWPLVPSSATK